MITTSLTRNGDDLLRTSNSLESWRHATLRAAFATMAKEGKCLYDFLSALGQYQSGYTVRTFSESKKRVYEALFRCFTQVEPIVIPAWDTYLGKADDRLYGWWRGSTENGNVYEIILCPDTYSSGDWIVAGEDAAEVHRLCDGIVADATKHTSRSLRFTGGYWEDAPEIDLELATVTYDDIVLPAPLLSDIRTNIDAFFQQKEIFHRLGFAWRRGVLFVGPPGTGKTMLCKAAANSHTEVRFLYVRDVGSSGSRRDNLRPMFEKARKLAPCILAIEDMDSLIQKENRSTFLNELDGFHKNDGMLIVASSNHPERIDEALLKRPSRFDRVYQIGLPEINERTEYCRRVLNKVALPVADGFDLDSLSARIAAETVGFTPAFLKEAIVSGLLTIAQSGRDTLDDGFGGTVLEQVQILKNYLKKANNPEAMAEMKAATGDIGFRSRF